MNNNIYIKSQPAYRLEMVPLFSLRQALFFSIYRIQLGFLKTELP